MRPMLYISGPITKGDPDHNFRQAADAQKEAMLAGFAVFNPMLSMRLPDAFAIPYETWIANDLPWLELADVIWRLPGYSEGANIECNHAAKHGVPVLHDMTELKRFLELWNR